MADSPLAEENRWMVALEHWLEEEETVKPVEKEVELLWKEIEEEGNQLVEANLEGKVEFQLEEGQW